MTRKLLVLIALFTCCALFFVACGKSDTTSNGNANSAATDNSKSSTTSSPATASSPSSASSTTSTSSGEKIGVAECDDYLAKYEACVSGKVPETSRAQYQKSLDDLRKSWRGLAANPQTKAGLAMACKMATDQSKEQFKQYGCDF